MKLFIPTILAVVVSSVAGFGFGSFANLKLDESQLLRSTSESMMRTSTFAEEFYFDQEIDHYDSEWNSEIRNKKFKQRYYRFDQHYKPGGPAFLFVGGNNELNSLWATQSLLAKAAELQGGVVFALEHRYYGKSRPTADLSTRNLRFLNARQAVRDIANFIKNVEIPDQPKGSNKRTKWILVSGSYGANLAAWTKLYYDDLIYGVIASSAPVQAEEYIFQFDNKVGQSIQALGGKQCLNYYNKFYQYLDHTLYWGNYREQANLKAKFGCTNVRDTTHFAETLAFDANLVQYNNPSSKEADKNVQVHCSQLKLNGSLQEIVDEVAENYKKSNNGVNCKNNFDISFLKETNPSSDSSVRQWLYQTCTEFGFFQIARRQQPATRSTLPQANYHLNTYCRSTFGYINTPSTYAFNRDFKGKDLRVNNVVFTNGEFDPWSTLSLLPEDLQRQQWNNWNQRTNMKSYIIKGAAHSSDITQIGADDSESVKQAKERNLDIIDKWVKGISI